MILSNLEHSCVRAYAYNLIAGLQVLRSRTFDALERSKFDVPVSFSALERKTTRMNIVPMQIVAVQYNVVQNNLSSTLSR